MRMVALRINAGTIASAKSFGTLHWPAPASLKSAASRQGREPCNHVISFGVPCIASEKRSDSGDAKEYAIDSHDMR